MDFMAQHFRKSEARLCELHASTPLPPCYHNRPVKRATAPEELVLPFALYLGGERYTREENVLGVWLVCLLTGHRFLIPHVVRASVVREVAESGVPCTPCFA